MSATLGPVLAPGERPTRQSAGLSVSRVLRAVGAGVALGGLVGMVADPGGTYVLAFVVGFPVALLITIGRITGAVRRSLPAAGPVPGGRLALARVESIRRTGVELNDQPQCELLLVVSPEALQPGTGRPYATTTRAIVDVVQLAAHQPGSVVVVQQPDPALPDVTLVAAPPADAVAAARAEARRDPESAAIPPLDRVPLREPAPVPLFGPAPSPGSVLACLVLLVAAGGAVLAPTLFG